MEQKQTEVIVLTSEALQRVLSGWMCCATLGEENHMRATCMHAISLAFIDMNDSTSQACPQLIADQVLLMSTVCKG